MQADLVLETPDPSINFRTVDRRPDEALLKLLSAKTGTPPDRVEAAAVPMYENFGVCRKDRNDDVLVYCPGLPQRGRVFPPLLAAGVLLIVRYSWSLAPRFLSRLPRSGSPGTAPVDAKSLATCHGCGFDLSKAELKCSRLGSRAGTAGARAAVGASVRRSCRTGRSLHLLGNKADNMTQLSRCPLRLILGVFIS
jgi:hypothetical protein